MVTIFIRSLSIQSIFTRRFFRSARALGVVLIVIASLLSAVDASALSRHRGTKYGTLTYTIHNLDGNYMPGQHYSIDATFSANDRVSGSQSSFMVVEAGGRTLCRRAVVVKKNRTTSASASFTAPTDGSPLRIYFGNKGNDVFESITISPIKVAEPEPEEEEVPPTTTEENPNNTDSDSNNDTGDGSDNGSYEENSTGNEDNNTGNENETANDDTGSGESEEENSDFDISSIYDDIISGILDNELVKSIQDYWADDPLGLDHEATPEEAAEIGAIASLISLFAGGLGAVGGGLGGIAGGIGGGIGGGAGAMGGGIPTELPPNLPEEYAFVEDYDWDKEDEDGWESEGSDDEPPEEPEPEYEYESESEPEPESESESESESEPDATEDSNPLNDNKYVTRNPDGSITVTDPVVGTQNTYEPDGNGGWDNLLTGGGFSSDAHLLSHLESRDENRVSLLQDAKQAAKNLEDHRKEWEDKVTKEHDQGFSKEMEEYRNWKQEQEQKLEHEIRTDHRILELSSKFHVDATKDAVMKALAEEQSRNELEGYEQQAIADEYGKSEKFAKNVKTTAAIGIVAVPIVAATGGAALGTGALTATEIAKAKLVYDAYTVSNSVVEFNGEAYMHNGSLKDYATATALGLVHGGLGVAQNHVGGIAGNNTIVNNTVGKFLVDTTVQGGLYVGSEVSKGALFTGYSEYEKTGDFYKAQEAALNSVPESAKSGAKSFLIQKTFEGVTKAGSALKEKISPSGTPSKLQGKIDSAKTNLKYQQGRVEGAKANLKDARYQAADLKDAATKKADIAKAAAEKSNVQAKEAAKATEKFDAAQQKVDVAKESLKTAKTPEAKEAAKTRLDNVQNEANAAKQEALKAQEQARIAKGQAKIASDSAARAESASKAADANVKVAQKGVNKALTDERIAKGKLTAAETEAKRYNADRPERVDYIAGQTGSTADAIEKAINNKDDNT